MKKYIQNISEVLELGAAILVLVAIIVSAAGLIFDLSNLRNMFESVQYFRDYLEEIFTLVIGIEFLQMLCKPNSDNVLETLIFLVARHMIIGETLSPIQDFLSVISVALLCIVRRYLHNAREEHKLQMQKLGKTEGTPLTDETNTESENIITMIHQFGKKHL